MSTELSRKCFVLENICLETYIVLQIHYIVWHPAFPLTKHTG